nr:RNA-directed DNA polymerase, eukaryota [Tanacetum cinerariifolium]
GTNVDSCVCPICSTGEDEINHILFRCDLAQQVLRRICRWWELDPSDWNTFQEWYAWFSSIRFSSKSKSLLEGTLFVAWWNIWRIRNLIIFEGVLPRRSKFRKISAVQKKFTRERDMLQMQKEKVPSFLPTDDPLERLNKAMALFSETESKKQDTSSRSRNDTDADNAYIRPIYDEESMAEVQLTAKCNIFTTGQQHTEQPEIINEEVNSRAKIQSNKTRNSNKPIEQKSHTQKPVRKIFTGHRFSPNMTSVVYEKTSPRFDLRWKPTGRIFKTVGLR